MKLKNGHERPKTAMKAIKEFCMECNGFNRKYVKECVSRQCPLYEFRLGKFIKDEESEDGYNIISYNDEEETNEEEVVEETE